ncbi:tyrosine-type recombinase/integrase [Nonomuraea aurantiaca]|uniref:tyrosine-type recombinase/integrase n=1 Tax=Nonomuraea aurantiaca TaxID=2878562 RepID=UPI001CD91AF0|nr:tyrosine-type recombinase/integrase [Nonomuraea aurantiaca]MCA2226339.1 tyrosine-type recombinase/integrase [Nonomuraea aurantiaca]
MPARVEPAATHPMAEPIAEFLTDLDNAARSRYTVRCYRGDLAQFARHHDGEVTAIDATVLRGFFTGIAGQAPATRARKRAAISEFLAWCRRNDRMDTDPMAVIEHVSVPERLPRGVEPGRVQRVLDAIPKRKLRDRVLFGLIHTTGLRASEALGVYVEDLTLDPDDEHLTVTAKGGRQRTILLDDPALLALLRRYLRDTRYTRGPLFRAEKNNIGGPPRYSSAEELWRKYRTAAGEKIELHQLRHGHATELINGGVPVETVRKRLGHKKISSTLLYAEKTDRAADDEIRTWRRQRRTPRQTLVQPSTKDATPARPGPGPG